MKIAGLRILTERNYQKAMRWALGYGATQAIIGLNGNHVKHVRAMPGGASLYRKNLANDVARQVLARWKGAR